VLDDLDRLTRLEPTRWVKAEFAVDLSLTRFN